MRITIRSFLLAFCLVITSTAHAADKPGRYQVDDGQGIMIDGRVVIGKETQVYMDTLKKALKGFSIRIEEKWGEGMRYYKYAVYRKGRKIMDITPDEEKNDIPYEIMIYRLFTDMKGISTGDTYRKLKSTGRIECGVIAETEDTFLCSREEETMQFLFDIPDVEALKRGHPADNDRIKAIRWFHIEGN